MRTNKEVPPACDGNSKPKTLFGFNYVDTFQLATIKEKKIKATESKTCANIIYYYTERIEICFAVNDVVATKKTKLLHRQPLHLKRMTR